MVRVRHRVMTFVCTGSYGVTGADLECPGFSGGGSGCGGGAERTPDRGDRLAAEENSSSRSRRRPAMQMTTPSATERAVCTLRG